MTNKVQKKVDARAYNHNQDSFTIENVIRWFDYWRDARVPVTVSAREV
mgnify:FL=1